MALSTITLVTLVTLATTPADLTARREHIAISQDVATALGIPTPLNGREFQVRIAVTAPATAAGNNANFTVDAILTGTNRVGIYPSTSGTATNGGIYKLFNSNTVPTGVKLTVYNQAPSSTKVDGVGFAGSFTEPSSGKSFKEFVTTGSDDLVIFAPHGGNIEEETSDELAALNTALLGHTITPAVWDVQGVWGSGQTFRRWHVTAPDINQESFPGLDYLIDTYTTFPHSVALHGFTWDNESATDSSTWKYGIVLGGRATIAEKLTVMEEIVAEVGANQISFVLADPTGDTDYPEGPNGSLMAFSGYTELRGIGTDNLVNRLSPSGGIQLEQSRGVREIFASEVATGIANGIHRILTGDLAEVPEEALVAVP